MDMHADVALDRTGQRVQLEIALAAGITGAVALSLPNQPLRLAGFGLFLAM